MYTINYIIIFFYFPLYLNEKQISISPSAL